jgi:hypothetical protein
MRFSLLLRLLFLGLIFLAACDNDPLKGDDEVQTVLDFSLAESEYAHLRQTFLLLGAQSEGFRRCDNLLVPGCPEARVSCEEHDDRLWVTVDYGDEALCEDGRRRSGRWVASLSGYWDQATVVARLQPEDYRLTTRPGQAYLVAGEQTLIHNGFSETGALSCTGQLREGVLTGANTHIYWQDDRQITQRYSPEAPPVFWGEGTASGVSSTGTHFFMYTLEPLRSEPACDTYTSGQLVLTPGNRLPRRVDFGEGHCDKLVSVTIEGFSRQVELP